MAGTHKIMIIAEVKDDADYKIIQRNIADFPEVVGVEPHAYYNPEQERG